MKKYLAILVYIIALFGMSASVEARLWDRGGGLIYDDDLNITWLQDANYSKTSGFDSDGRMAWGDAVTWANGLSFAGYDDWRLPTHDPTCRREPRRGRYGFAFNCTNGEIGHLYYIGLGNLSTPVESGWLPTEKVGPFINLIGFRYWANLGDGFAAWNLNFASGYQRASVLGNEYFAWPVRDGDSMPAGKVSIETAITDIEAIITAIQAGAPNVGDFEKASKILNEVNGILVASLNSFQATDPSRLIVDPLLADGTAFFGHNKEAVKKIYKAIEQGMITDLTLLIQLENVVANKMLEAYKIVAQVAINDAINAVGITNEDVIRARIDLETGNQLTNNGIKIGVSALAFFDEAVKSYGHAWEFAQQAVGVLPAD